MVGGTVGAFLTGRAMIRQALTQAVAEGREQQRHWLRERREDAYAGFLSGCDDVLDALEGVLRVTYRPEDAESRSRSAEAWGTVNAALRSASRAARRIAVIGPPGEMPARALELYEALHTLADSQRMPGMPADQRMIAWAEQKGQADRMEERFVALANALMHGE
ncbi:hypothetical protein JK364_51210 [Streptomyces sp. 110]|uniref:SAV-6107-like HEPN domain-containing protein n=1 Tax=Streptomyces endocoffeicus TaxID=2898945 RepID=A0ABS1Q7F5_9ACTN|nr:hypothetical protein [Streptomyces endocoffeicus]MBL1120602.1 hypothetical protein [Streptomyces endocoffeicus]